ncbi:c-type cytochrome, methanol metabolism-related [Paracoccus sp. P2]|mgnify:CR=1 FL=1|uniref:C-type cytochrome, methanol metabolism-related n=1 Tax=Paracoccus pantotrophus TaxID=82367 RepID=A0A1I5GPC8_PARPN|nr:c-type cytochrome, methanol metabolism-related [Paracoccus pantotrophus]MDF3854404.1 c-type cytochrome, methanol metabolism-related [Paracoccus pantotrophus]QFG38526.1 c-type cytochrome, methanol metabolism-related [Paracoccus pantotrophus]QLH16207.1 c-type cytochrome, methanol metabolism-related [Paracoccus pantotrophus]RDE01992.1 c-type cytochrome, methanol metabolism-related [Paracoccus pantotrophus]RKS50942.1 methanol metabolism-related c-type cytochrome [Paracoccus pantotrophus]
MTSKTTASLMAIRVACAAFAITGTALAQTADTPPAQAGAGAAAAVSGDAQQQQPAAGAPAEAEEAPAVAEADGKLVLPNGQDITPDHMENGRWYTAEDIPTFKIAEDGTVDWATFSGYRRYSAECHVCHGPDGEGSTYAPALKKSVLTLGYYDFLEIAASGKQEVNVAANLVMPAFGTNKNVWCYIDDIYAYLLARGLEELPRGRPAKREDKSDEFVAQEDSCMSG